MKSPSAKKIFWGAYRADLLKRDVDVVLRRDSVYRRDERLIPRGCIGNDDIQLKEAGLHDAREVHDGGNSADSDGRKHRHRRGSAEELSGGDGGRRRAEANTVKDDRL